jgi:hypothetical protein
VYADLTLNWASDVHLQTSLSSMSDTIIQLTSDQYVFQ